LARELATLASGPEGDLQIAYETYARLLEREPADRSLWEPALNVLMRLGDRNELPSFVSRTLASLLMLEDRLYLLQAYANQLMQWGDDQAAADVLGQILEEEPAHLEATNQLLSIYERHGMHAELMGLMQQQFDRARDERNVDAIVELGLRLGQLYAGTSAQLACDVLRSALDWQPDNHALLKALIERLPPDSDARERGELMMRRRALPQQSCQCSWPRTSSSLVTKTACAKRSSTVIASIPNRLVCVSVWKASTLHASCIVRWPS
jgi:tetratricopeptide (TPR) repeat protein